jgi:hypothetical protein
MSSSSSPHLFTLPVPPSRSTAAKRSSGAAGGGRYGGGRCGGGARVELLAVAGSATRLWNLGGTAPGNYRGGARNSLLLLAWE